jgi:hypothetical protein
VRPSARGLPVARRGVARAARAYPTGPLSLCLTTMAIVVFDSPGRSARLILRTRLKSRDAPAPHTRIITNNVMMLDCSRALLMWRCDSRDVALNRPVATSSRLFNAQFYCCTFR